jgi:hypothetical protein
VKRSAVLKQERDRPRFRARRCAVFFERHSRTDYTSKQKAFATEENMLMQTPAFAGAAGTFEA